MRLFALALVLIAPAANAEFVTYEYRGNPWTYYAPNREVDGEWEAGVNPFLPAPSQDYITGWMTIDTDYLPGGSIENVSYYVDATPCDECTADAIHAWSFFDGLRLDYFPGRVGFVVVEIGFSTDKHGNLVSWDLTLDDDPDSLGIDSRFGDYRSYTSCGTGYDITCVENSAPGTWTKVPEPGAFALALVGLLGAWFLRRRKAAALLSLAMIAPAANAALVTYEYRGAEYGYFATEQPSEEEYEFVNPWTDATQRFVTGSVTMDTDVLVLANATYEGEWFYAGVCDECTSPLVAWNFFDGVDSANSTSEGVFFNGGYIRFTTDADGNFTSWGFRFIGDPEGLTVSSSGDRRLAWGCTDTSSDQLCARSYQAGVWTRVPEPSALLLALPSMLLLMLTCSRRRVKGRLTQSL